MRRFRPLRSATAVGLIALLGAMSTGLPSHSHERPERADPGPTFVSADHHSHGTQLVEQDERAPSTAPGVRAASTRRMDAPARLVVATPTARQAPIRPTERAPPPGAPRAPPRLA